MNSMVASSFVPLAVLIIGLVRKCPKKTCSACHLLARSLALVAGLATTHHATWPLYLSAEGPATASRWGLHEDAREKSQPAVRKQFFDTPTPHEPHFTETKQASSPYRIEGGSGEGRASRVWGIKAFSVKLANDTD